MALFKYQIAKHDFYVVLEKIELIYEATIKGKKYSFIQLSSGHKLQFVEPADDLIAQLFPETLEEYEYSDRTLH